MAFIAYFQRLFGPLSQLTNLASLYSQGGAALDKINALLDEKPTITERPGARPLAHGPGEVRMEGVTFSYDGKRTVIDDADIVFPAGKITAIVGHNGAGKSTLVSLISRFYEPERGRITIDGTDVRDVTLTSLRRAVSFSLQDTSLLSGHRAGQHAAGQARRDRRGDRPHPRRPRRPRDRAPPPGRAGHRGGPVGRAPLAGPPPGRRAGAHDPGRPVDLHPRRVHVGRWT